MHGMNKTRDSTITEIRTRINDIDVRLVQLLNQRAEAAVAIGDIKAVTGEKIYDPAREGDVLNNIDALNAGPLPKGSLEEIYQAILTACREIQLRS
jgi:chorismate mutase